MTTEVEGKQELASREVGERIAASFQTIEDHWDSFGSGAARILLRVNHPLPIETRGASVTDEETTFDGEGDDPVEALLDIYRGLCHVRPEEEPAREMGLRQIAAAWRRLAEHVMEQGYTCTPSCQEVAFVLCVGRTEEASFYAAVLYFGEAYARMSSYGGRRLQDPVLAYGDNIAEAVETLWRYLDEGVYSSQLRSSQVA